MASSSTGTFKPLRHRSGTMRERLHSYTQRTLGAGGSYSDAVSSIGVFVFFVLHERPYGRCGELCGNSVSFLSLS